MVCDVKEAIDRTNRTIEHLQRTQEVIGISKPLINVECASYPNLKCWLQSQELNPLLEVSKLCVSTSHIIARPSGIFT